MSTGIATTLYELWSSFGLPAFVENAVPDDAELPYITYTLVTPAWGTSAIHQVRVWYRDTSYTAINSKLDDIVAMIGEGLRIATSGGGVVVYPGSPLVQFQPMEEQNLKVAYLNFELRSYIK